MTEICDKYRVRDYVKAKGHANYLILLLWHGEDPEKISFAALTTDYVIKETHGCGFNIFIRRGTEKDPEQVKSQLRQWLKRNYCLDFHIGIEWGYKNVKPSIIIEAFVAEKGKFPVDYKFYCFSGKVEFLTVHFGRYEGHKTKSFNREFKYHEFRYQFPQWEGEIDKPVNFDLMIRIAESLAKDFDFVRVDLYSVGGKIYFNELTLYPGGVTTSFLPLHQDCILGKRWE